MPGHAKASCYLILKIRPGFTNRTSKVLDPSAFVRQSAAETLQFEYRVGIENVGAVAVGEIVQIATVAALSDSAPVNKTGMLPSTTAGTNGVSIDTFFAPKEPRSPVASTSTHSFAPSPKHS